MSQTTLNLTPENFKSDPDFDAEDAFSFAVDGYVCGVDEVGRGPLAGPVVAAAVILDKANIPSGLNDSKTLSHNKRRKLDGEIRSSALSFCVAQASVEEIDQLNILQATLLAMHRAVDGLGVKPSGALIDGNRAPKLSIATKTIVKGDKKSLSIAAASIIAKVFRDDLMKNLAKIYPDYGWEKNAGYGVRGHKEALRLVGISPHHRKSFAPIRTILNEE